MPEWGEERKAIWTKPESNPGSFTSQATALSNYAITPWANDAKNLAIKYGVV